MRYQNGVEVRKGDVVAINREGHLVKGVVRKIILPNTQDSRTWAAPEGGVLIEGGGLGLSVTRSLEDDEDVVFVRRGEDRESPGDDS